MGHTCVGSVTCWDTVQILVMIQAGVLGKGGVCAFSVGQEGRALQEVAT